MTRLVVVGHGMVGSRLVEEVLALDTAGRFRITVLGDEAGRPYNRVLLSEVVSGHRSIGSIELPTPADARLDVRADLAAASIDREDRVVVDVEGGRHRYDRLVLATGAAARLPDLPGLAAPSGTPRGVHVLRGIDDARDLLAATLNARSAVVLGAGVLGLEAAAALAHRGLEVTVVHPHPALMERQLDPGASAVLTGTMERLGLRHRADVRTTGVRVADGRFVGLRLDDGTIAEADLLVVSTGTVPRTGLAARAGLPVARGVVVDSGLTSPADRRVLAVGDCAEPPDGATGLVAQGWAQARVAASVLTGTPHPEREDRPGPAGADVVRLKAPGLDVVTMGVCGSRREAHPGRRHLWLSDPSAGRHVEVVVEGDRLVGATCVGAGSIATELVTTYTRRSPVPTDPALLLLPLLAGATAARSGDVTTLPDDATICRCNGVSKASILGAVGGGAAGVEDVAAATRATTGCGGCRDDVCALLAAAPGRDGSATAFTPPKPDLITTETRGA